IRSQSMNTRIFLTCRVGFCSDVPCSDGKEFAKYVLSPRIKNAPMPSIPASCALGIDAEDVFCLASTWDQDEMADLSAIVAQLKAERAKLDKAIEALSGVAGKAGSGGRGTRRLSAPARERIAAAQRARWAKFKAKKGK